MDSSFFSENTGPESSGDSQVFVAITGVMGRQCTPSEAFRGPKGPSKLVTCCHPAAAFICALRRELIQRLLNLDCFNHFVDLLRPP